MALLILVLFFPTQTAGPSEGLVYVPQILLSGDQQPKAPKPTNTEHLLPAKH